MSVEVFRAGLATLITSELVTNAVLHAGIPLEMTVSRCDSRLRIDHSLQPPALTRVESVATTGRGDAGGRRSLPGLGVVTTPGGRLVWALLAG